MVFVFGRLPTNGLLDVPSDSLIELRGVVTMRSGELSVETEAIDGQIGSVPLEPQAKKAKKRSSRAACIDALKKALREHLVAARDHYYDALNKERGSELLPRPTQQELADGLKVHVSSVNRAIKDKSDRELKVLWQAADDIEQIKRYKG